MKISSEERDIIQRILQHHAQGTTDMTPEMMANPVENYASDKVLEAEQQILFREFPLILAHSSELPDAGSFLTNKRNHRAHGRVHRRNLSRQKRWLPGCFGIGRMRENKMRPVGFRERVLRQSGVHDGQLPKVVWPLWRQSKSSKTSVLRQERPLCRMGVAERVRQQPHLHGTQLPRRLWLLRLQGQERRVFTIFHQRMPPEQVCPVGFSE